MTIDTNSMISITEANQKQKMYLQFLSTLLNKIWRLMRNLRNDKIK